MIKIPTYCYRCPNPECLVTVEVVKPIGAVSKEHICPKCETLMVRDYRAEQVHIGDKEYSRPIVSDSLAIMPSQRAEHEKRFPNIKLDDECRPVFTDYKSHQKYLDDCGLKKARQRIKKRGKRIV